MNPVTKVVGTLNSVRRHPLSQGRGVRSMWEFVVAQLASRRVPGEVCVELANGTRLLVPPHMKGAAHFIYPGMNEFDEMAFVLHFLRPDDLFADIGANIGAYTVLAAAGIYGDIARKVAALGDAAWDRRVTTSAFEKIRWIGRAFAQAWRRKTLYPQISRDNLWSRPR